jgi:tRNA(Ile)-lysidine synthase
MRSACSRTGRPRLRSCWRCPAGRIRLALMWLAARWRKRLDPRAHGSMAVTVDHGLRPGGRPLRRAPSKSSLAKELDLAPPHAALDAAIKPKSRIAGGGARCRAVPAAGASGARASGASHMLTAHTRDDQAETVHDAAARAAAALPAWRPWRGSPSAAAWCWHARFLDVPKSRLVATLEQGEGSGFADDPTNRDDPRFTRPRLRALMPALAEEGGDSRSRLARLAGRLRRANAALEIMADGAERYLASMDGGGSAFRVRSCGVCGSVRRNPGTASDACD